MSTTPDSQLGPPLELSVVMPCLNEEGPLETCIRKAQRAMAESGIAGEVIVADNGSTDGSVASAEQLGARVIHVSQRGYGAALMGGIEAARGRYVIMGDADDSYDFLEIPRFVDKLREGYDLVLGCRLPTGGGKIMDGAMPTLHRWIGNPFFSKMVRLLFKVPTNDVFCGMRGFTKEAYSSLNQRCTGMEFANEMVVAASLFGKRITEIPITLHVDGRTTHPPHLRTFRDGWRTLRFLLLCSPRWTFLGPALLLILLGIVGYALALPGTMVFGGHTLLFGSLAILVGHQAIVFGIVSRTFAAEVELLPQAPALHRFERFFSLERGMLLGLCAAGISAVLLLVPVWRWWSVSFGPLDYEQNLRWVVPGVTAGALAVQTILASFLLNLMRIGRKRSTA